MESLFTNKLELLLKNKDDITLSKEEKNMLLDS